MRKYLFIIKTQMMSNLQYVFNLIITFIGYFIMLFILFNLWQYLYSDSNELINGYSMGQMTWYVIITELLWMILGGRSLCNKISNDVKSGNITYNINKPYNYIGYCLSTHIGNILVNGIIYGILCLIAGFIFLGYFPSLNIFGIIFIIITMFLALVISVLLIVSIGLFSFFIEDSGPFYWVYSKIILVLGTIFPIEFFPRLIQIFLKFSPVYVVCYGPAKLFVDFSWSKALSILGAQIIYIFLAYTICSIIYKKGVRRINVNGG